MKHLPLAPVQDSIDEITIASPCNVPWDSMRGDERVRFCGHCRQNVYNIAAMTRPEARWLVESTERRSCLRLLRRDDGTVVTSDCWTRLRAARRKGPLTFLGVLLVVGWAQLWAIRFGLSLLYGWHRERPPCLVAAPPAPLSTGVPLPPPELPSLSGWRYPLMGEPPPPPAHPPRRHLLGKRKAPPGGAATMGAPPPATPRAKRAVDPFDPFQ